MRRMIAAGLMGLCSLFVLRAETPPEPMPEWRTSLAPVVPLEEGFQQQPNESHTRVWWWWLNGNVDRESIARDLREMKDKGIGGYNLIDAGGADQRGNRRVPAGPRFGSPEWIDLFRYTLDESERLGLECGLMIQSGWNLGGPMVTPEEAAKKITWSESQVQSLGNIDMTLPQPPNRDNFYRDFAVVAFPLNADSGNAAVHRPEIRSSSAQPSYPPDMILDGNSDTMWVSGSEEPGQGPSAGHPEWIELVFPTMQAMDAVSITGRPGYSPKRIEVQTEQNGVYQTAAHADIPDGQTQRVSFPNTSSQKLRILITDAYDQRFPDQPRNAQVTELDILSGGQSLLGYSAPGQAKQKINNFEKKAYYEYPGGFTAIDASFLQNYESDDMNGTPCNSDDIVDLTGAFNVDSGRLTCELPAGSWLILRFGYTITGSRVSTSSDSWQGLSIDYLDRSALESYWYKVMQPILDAAGDHKGHTWKYCHTDSWELGPVNWTPAFPSEFNARRGYDMMKYMPALAGYVIDSRDVTNRFLNDFRRTIADCIADNHYLVFAQLANEYGMGIHPESGGPHCAPLDALKNLGRSAVPMGEFWARNNEHRVADDSRLFIKQSASAAHIYGLRINQAEAFTTIGPHWERSPRDLKNVLDRVYCEGLNRVVLHTFTCSPASMGLPGQEYFAGTHFNPNVTWWDLSGWFIGYMNRCQYILQQGLPVSDVLYFYGDNVPSFVRLKRDDPAGALPGFDYDVCNEEVLLTRTRVENGRIALPDGASYLMLALPKYGTLSLTALKHVAQLIDNGALVLGAKPRRSDLCGGPQADEEFRQLADRIWGEQPAAEGRYNIGKGYIAWGTSANQLLNAAGVAPDFTYTYTQPNTLLDFIHRRTDEAEIYFVINRWAYKNIQDDTYRPRITPPDRYDDVVAKFRINGKVPELWDPKTGKISSVGIWWEEGGQTNIPMHLGPEESVFVVFRNPASGAAAHGYALSLNGQQVIPAQDQSTIAGGWEEAQVLQENGQLKLAALSPGKWELSVNGKQLTATVDQVSEPMQINGPWTVTFPEKWGWPNPQTYTELMSWSLSEIEEIRYYSGIAIYETNFTVDGGFLENRRIVLDLGDVREIADVEINGTAIGGAWHEPFRLEVTGALQTGENTIRIRVANLWVNRLLGDLKLPPIERFTKTNITKFENGHHSLQVSGLLGPVMLKPYSLAAFSE
ncbi:discoidin domain-containing protein [Candidatus Sumerlaeota bacterium]|nr:discoidin domain-containing protein [Candidatus Sumerlaeota bacterium]